MRGSDYPATFERPFDCARDCQREDGFWDRALRSARGCTRADLPPVPWDVDARALYSRPAGKRGIYLGRWPSKAIADLDDVGVNYPRDEPLEPPADGCPAGWAHSPFADSVDRYARRRTRDGGRVPNRLLDDPETPWYVWEAVEYLEREQERWHQYREEVDAKRWADGPGKPKG